MTDISSNWQDSLNTGLVNRLNRPLSQPGMMKMSMSQGIINRCDRLLNRLPLLSQQIQRWGKVNPAVSNDIPIVYAQTISASNQAGLEKGAQNNSQPTVPVIQRKAQPIENLTTSENITPALTLENQINQTPISASEIPIVSSQTRSAPITGSEKLALQSNITNGNNSVPSIQLKSDISQSSAIKSANNISFSENITPALTLENKTNQTNQTSRSALEIPLVSSPARSEHITETEAMPLLPEVISSSEQLTIVQIKQQNSDILSSNLPVTSYLPVTNPLNTFPNSQQTRQENNSVNNAPRQQENLGTEIYLKELPIVTTQPVRETSPTKNNSSEQHNYLPVIAIPSSINTLKKNQPLPLTKNYSPSPTTNNSQAKLSNNISSSLPKVLPLPSPPAETIVSPLANQSNNQSNYQNSKKLDVNTIVNQVERKLMRRLVIESERRGKIR